MVAAGFSRRVEKGVADFSLHLGVADFSLRLGVADFSLHLGVADFSLRLGVVPIHRSVRIRKLKFAATKFHFFTEVREIRMQGILLSLTGCSASTAYL